MYGIPKSSEMYTEEWLRTQVVKVLSRHGARIINIERDISFPEDGSIVIITDGIDHMILAQDEETAKAARNAEELDDDEFFDEEEKGEQKESK